MAGRRVSSSRSTAATARRWDSDDNGRHHLEDVQDLIVATVEHRYGQVNHVPEPIEWLIDNGSCYTQIQAPLPGALN
jgi:hypothetical protein